MRRCLTFHHHEGPDGLRPAPQWPREHGAGSAHGSRILPQIGRREIASMAEDPPRDAERRGRERFTDPLRRETSDLTVVIGGKDATCGRFEPLLSAVHNQFADAFRIERFVSGAK